MANPKHTATEIELDLGRYELRRRGRRVKLAQKPLDLLIFLVARKDQLVSRHEIVAKLWRSDLFIDTEPGINNIVRKIRAALGDNSAKPRYLETVVGKGYRFIGPVRVIDARSSHSHLEKPRANEARPPSSSPQSERPSLAVLPLFLLGKNSDDHGISLGFAEALVSRLGNLQGLDVLPASAMLNLPAEITIADVASRLGVRFVVHGALQESKGQLRLSLEMFDAHSQAAAFTRKCDLELSRLSELEDEIAKQIAGALNRPLHSLPAPDRPRYSKDPMAYAEFVRGFRLSSSGDSAAQDEAAQRLTAAVTRDPNFALAHATLSLVCATRHFESDPANAWLDRAEFHCRRALEIDPDLPEAHVANAFLLWGPSKNFQHLEAIAELRRALTRQKNLPQAYNRLGTILAHIGLLDHAREMFERARLFHPQKAVSHSITQVYFWSGQYDLAREQIHAWRTENPASKYAVYFAAHLAMVTGDRKRAKSLLDEAAHLVPNEPLLISLQGVHHAMAGKSAPALECITRACAIAKSFGHAHHTYYQIACILALLDRPQPAFDWLERSVSTGFACWPFFASDPGLQNLRHLPEFEVLITSLQSKYPDHLGLLWPGSAGT
jgi:DNA-binding winged helix-turn-helix (wHTH) protein/tetratricopeptide (TPR) repeat protein